jgi:hypothetical protein
MRAIRRSWFADKGVQGRIATIHAAEAAMHDVLIVSVPLITILAGLFFNRSEMQHFRSEMKAEMKELRSEVRAEVGVLRSEMNARFDRMDAEMNGRFDRMDAGMNSRFDRIDAGLRYFHGVTGKLDGGIESLEKR